MKISVVIPTYNRQAFIKKAILCVLNQTVNIDEIIVIDDGSTDDTKKIIQDLDIKYIYQENKGVSSARNAGIKAAKNEWIAFLDSDDIWNETKIEEQIAFHDKNPHILLSHTDELWIRNDKVINQKKHQQKPSGFCFLDNLPACKIGPSTVMMHKDLFDVVGLFDEDLTVCEDYDLWLRISKEHEIGYIPKKLMTKYAGHENQLSFTTFAIDTYRITALEKQLNTKLNTEQKKEVIKELVNKCTLLLKGAKKHNNTDIIQTYEEKLTRFNTFDNI